MKENKKGSIINVTSIGSNLGFQKIQFTFHLNQPCQDLQIIIL